MDVYNKNLINDMIIFSSNVYLSLRLTYSIARISPCETNMHTGELTLEVNSKMHNGSKHLPEC